MTRKEHERRAAKALAKMANECWGGEGYYAEEWLERPVPSRAAALTLLADAYEQNADRDARIAADAATIERHREVAREIGEWCDDARHAGLIKKTRALAEAVNLAAQIAPPAEETPMTAEEALEKAGENLGTFKAEDLIAELAKLGFAVVAKGDAK